MGPGRRFLPLAACPGHGKVLDEGSQPSVRSGSQGCFVTFGTVREKVTCQMERACRALLGLSCSRVLVKESDSLQLEICQCVLARILLTCR